MVVTMYHKTAILGLTTFLADKFALWAGNVSCIEEILKSYKDIVLYLITF
jgi:hypothetical protein